MVEAMKRRYAILAALLSLSLPLSADVNRIPGWVNALLSGNIFLERTITAAASTGNKTINKMAGTVRIAAAGTTVTVTNANVNTSSICFATIQTADATAILKNAVPGAGSLVLTTTAAVTAETAIGWFCTN